jgi:hypothetical protein
MRREKIACELINPNLDSRNCRTAAETAELHITDLLHITYCTVYIDDKSILTQNLTQRIKRAQQLRVSSKKVSSVLPAAWAEGFARKDYPDRKVGRVLVPC